MCRRTTNSRPLPRGARPDLTVDGTIELERLDDVISVGRPVFGQEGAGAELIPRTTKDSLGRHRSSWYDCGLPSLVMRFNTQQRKD